MTHPIWTLEARDSVMLEVIASYFDLSDENMRREIWGARRITADALDTKGVSYDRLRAALVPQMDRFEIGFLFDTARTESDWYGYEVAERLIPLLPRDLLCSIRIGDLIIENQDLGFELLERHVVARRPTEIRHTSQLYCVYVNNLSAAMVRDITAALRDYDAFVGYADVSTSSRMKDWLSITLVTAYLKAREVALNGHEDDLPDTEDQNMHDWPWEANGYRCRSIRDMYFHLFLGYKIERRVVPGFESDTQFALTAISGRSLPLGDLPVALEEAKAEYLRREKAGSLKRAGLGQMTDGKLARLIRAKISESYIYNLRYLEESDTSLFNIMLEVEQPEGQGIRRLLAGLEYEPETPGLRLVTLY